MARRRYPHPACALRAVRRRRLRPDPRRRTAHLAAIALVAAEALLGITCPLTRWEDILRATGREERSFIGRWLAWLLYYDLPEWVFAIAYCAFAAAVIRIWRAIPPRSSRA